MTTQLIDDNALAKQLRAKVAQRAAALTTHGHQPDLAVILVGKDPAGQAYVRNKIKAYEDNGSLSSFDRYPADLSEADLLSRIDALNRDPRVHGILIQLPLPKHIDSHEMPEAIAPEKDVDGFHVANAGALMTGAPLFHSCTPYGRMKILELINYPVHDTSAVMASASDIVGKSMAVLLLRAGATITTCNSKTHDLAAYTCEADIIVAAVSRHNVITADMVKPGTVAIDVGMNRDDAGKLCGDVDSASVREVVGYATPVPDGVNPMAITILLINTLGAAGHAAGGAALAV